MVAQALRLRTARPSRLARGAAVSATLRAQPVPQRLQQQAPPLVTAALAGVVALCLTVPSAALARVELPNKEVDDATSPYVQKLLQRTAENKDRYTKERLQDYYKRNFKDYFEFEAGNAKTGRARGLSPEMQKQIDAWLEANK